MIVLEAKYHAIVGCSQLWLIHFNTCASLKYESHVKSWKNIDTLHLHRLMCRQETKTRLFGEIRLHRWSDIAVVTLILPAINSCFFRRNFLNQVKTSSLLVFTSCQGPTPLWIWKVASGVMTKDQIKVIVPVLQPLYVCVLLRSWMNGWKNRRMDDDVLIDWCSWKKVEVLLNSLVALLAVCLFFFFLPHILHVNQPLRQSLTMTEHVVQCVFQQDSWLSQLLNM